MNNTQGDEVQPYACVLRECIVIKSSLSYTLGTSLHDDLHSFFTPRMPNKNYWVGHSGPGTLTRPYAQERERERVRCTFSSPMQLLSC